MPETVDPEVKVYSKIEEVKVANAVVTIGMFDGIHLGHQELLNALVQQAKEQNGQSVVVTFWPHPRIVLGKNADDLRFITALEEKTVLMSQLGVDVLVLLPFTLDLAKLTSEEFIRDLLIKHLNLKYLLVGYNHRFGNGTEHGFEFYKQFAQKYNFGIKKIEPVVVQNQTVSSTVIRNHLQSGNVEDANMLLGYNYYISGTVVGGNRLGRTIGYPTANVVPEEKAKLIPLDGVYACRIKVLGTQFIGMMNIGYRPTVSQQLDKRTIEVHIFDFHQDVYSEEVEVEVVSRIRNEMKFEGVEQLKEQLKKDEEDVSLYFKSRK